MKLRLLFGTLMLTAITANAQVAIIDENFESAVVSTPPNYNNLVNGWTKKVMLVHNIYIDKNADSSNKYVQFYAAGSTSTDVYLVSPQIVAPDGSKQITFTATPTLGSTLEVALVDNPESLVPGSPVPASYQLLQTYTFTAATPNPVITPVTVPSSTKQYIVFRFRNPQVMGPNISHAALSVDNIKYNTASSLTVSDVTKSKEEIKFAINTDNTELQFFTKKAPKNIEVYSTGGQKVLEGKLQGNKFNINSLQTGVYYILIETTEGSVIKSKFIKK